MSQDPARIDEHVLRRALRLDAEEIPARLDPAILAAAARAARPARGQLAAVAGVAFLGGWVWSEAVRAVGAALTGTVDPLGALIQIGTAALVSVGPVLDLAAHPAIPIAVLAAAVLAALSERRRSHVPAS